MRKRGALARARRACVAIRNERGLHARPAAKFVQCAQPFTAEITVAFGGQTVSGRSILGLMMLAVPHGAEIEIVARGSDAKAALAALVALVESGFGEPN